MNYIFTTRQETPYNPYPVQQMAKKTSRGKRPANYEKDNDSDKEVDLSNIENDPNESTYCLCEKVRNFFTFYIYRDPFF